MDSIRPFPAWSARRPERAVPALPVPALAAIGGAALLAGQRRLAALFATRVFGGLVMFGLCLVRGWWIGLLPATWIIYGGSLTAVHHLIHGPLGLSPAMARRLRTLLAAIVIESGDALESTHLAHHGEGPADPEGWIEHVPWRRMPVEAFRFRYRLMAWGLRHGEPARRRRIRMEVMGHVAIHGSALALWPLTWWPAAYVAAMALASASFAVMAGKGPQANWGRPVATPLVRVRAHLASALLFSHDRHLEHHAYPQVPLPRLRRLDAALAPVLDRLPLVEVRLP
jgi:beta-carotene hydroxylase